MPQLELTLPAIVLIPFAAAVLALWLGRFAGQRTGILMVLAAAASFAGCLQVVTAVHRPSVSRASGFPASMWR